VRAVRYVYVPMGDDTVERRLMRMQAEAPTFHVPGLIGSVDVGGPDRTVSQTWVVAPEAPMVCAPAVAAAMVQHNAEVAAASMAAVLARNAMSEQLRGGTVAGAEVLDQGADALDRTIEALAPQPGWTTHPDGSQSYYDEALSDTIGAAVDEALLVKFEGVRPGIDGYFWFVDHRADGTVEHVVRRVVRDGSGSLWTDEGGHGVRVTGALAAACVGPVAPVDRDVRPLPDEGARADAQETAAFAVYDALTLLIGEAGLGPRVAPDQLQAWAQQILASLLRADVGWAIRDLTDADAILRTRVRKRREALADHVHMVWARWMAWQGEHAHLVPKAAALAMNTAAIERWARQAQIPYMELGEVERASDWAIAEEYVAILLGD
jgi:hypothetical protein